MKKIIQVDGGLGRVIAFTGALEVYKRQNPDVEIDIISSNPEVFKFNPHIDRVFPLNTPYLWDHIKDADYLNPEPYNHVSYYHDRKHIIEVYVKLLTGEAGFELPKLYVSESENAEAEAFVKGLGKPLVLFQPHGQTGGRGVEDPTHRSVPDKIAKKICDALAAKNEVYIIKAPDQQGVNGVKTFNNLPIRNIFALVPHAKHIISCDSFLHHAAAALGKPAFVFWRATHHENLSYESHTNIVAEGKIFEIPNRLPHNIMHYENKNTANKFTDAQVDALIEKVNT